MVAKTWVDQGFIAYDTETTGIDVGQSRIVTAAAIHFVDRRPVESRSWLIAVDVEIPEAASAIHGVTTQMSRDQGLEQVAALADIRSFLVGTGVPVVCFKSDFDIPVTDSNLIRAGLAPLPSGLAVCAYVIDRQFNKYVKGKAQRRLQPTAARYGITLNDADWHGAQADAIAAGQIFLAEVAAYPALTAVSAEQLSEQVDQWREAQELEFQQWLARQEPN
ncbi:MAG: hypothetical protein CK552_05940 [Actinobacteria bacterium]|nr:MAG: hypothetical protein CK552_05940 [Actinomycetota bacterium]